MYLDGVHFIVDLTLGCIDIETDMSMLKEQTLYSEDKITAGKISGKKLELGA